MGRCISNARFRASCALHLEYLSLQGIVMDTQNMVYLELYRLGVREYIYYKNCVSPGGARHDMDL